MSRGSLIHIDDTIELMKITDEKYRYVNSAFSKPTAKLSDHTADINLKVGNEYYKAHRDVLSSASDYFSAMFSHDMAEKGKDYIELRGISPGGFQIMLEYFYHGYITLVMENVRHCLEASRFFHVEWLTLVCSNYLMRHLSIQNCLKILHLVDTFSLLDLEDDMYAFIGLNPLAIFAEEEGSPDPSYYDVIHHLISKDYYIDLPEEMVLKMLIDWANIDFQEREGQLIELLQHVKFHILTPEQLGNIPPPILEYRGVRGRVDSARALWDSPHRWALDNCDISARGGREVLVLISEWNEDLIRMIDLNNPRAHEEEFGLIYEESLADFTSLACSGDFLYCVGGYDTMLQSSSSFLMYDSRTRLWIRLPPMNQCRDNFPTVVLDTKIYALAGSGLSYRQSSITEEDGAGGDNSNTGTMESSEPKILRDCECYNPQTDRWTSVPALPNGLYAHAACHHNGTIYITGGVTDNLSDSVPAGYCYSWTPGQASWTRKCSMLNRRQSHAMFSSNNKLYVMGGYTAGDLEDLSLGMVNCTKNEVYDPVTDKWEALMDTPEEFGHLHKTVAIMNNVVYLLGSVNSTRYLHEFHLDCEELVKGGFCGKNFVKLIKLKMYYPRFMPNDFNSPPEINNEVDEISEQLAGV